MKFNLCGIRPSFFRSCFVRTRYIEAVGLVLMNKVKICSVRKGNFAIVQFEFHGFVRLDQSVLHISHGGSYIIDFKLIKEAKECAKSASYCSCCNYKSLFSGR